MDDRRQVGKVSQYETSHRGQLSLAISLWVGAVTISGSWDVNRHGARCTSPHICSCNVNWWMRGKKIKISTAYRPCGLGRSLHFTFTIQLHLLWMAGNVACAVHAAAQLGSTAFGMFIKCQNKLQSEPLSSEEVSAFKKALVVCMDNSRFS